MTNTATLTTYKPAPKLSWYQQHQQNMIKLESLIQEVATKRLQEINAKLDALQDKKNA